MRKVGKNLTRMTAPKRKRLEASGWIVGSAEDFLGLTAEERAIVEMRLNLSAVLKNRRRALGLSQTALARQLASSQSRLAKMEAADPSVSLDLLLRALLAAGVTRRELARAIAA
jgi:ribosome-binding protein aMBF1 (putative translation factor)